MLYFILLLSFFSNFRYDSFFCLLFTVISTFESEERFLVFVKAIREICVREYMIMPPTMTTQDVEVNHHII